MLCIALCFTLHCIALKKASKALWHKNIILHCVALYYIALHCPAFWRNCLGEEGSALLHINTNYCSCPGLAGFCRGAAGNRRGHDTSITRVRAVIQTSHWEPGRRQKQRISSLLLLLLLFLLSMLSCHVIPRRSTSFKVSPYIIYTEGHDTPKHQTGVLLHTWHKQLNLELTFQLKVDSWLN